MGRIVETFWSCPYCNTKDIRGRYRECPNCGQPRGNVKFEIKNPTENYVSEEEAKTISKEPDWYCDYCNTLNSAKDIVCKSCGSSKTESTKDYFDLHKKEEKDEKEIEEEKEKEKEKEKEEEIEYIDNSSIINKASKYKNMLLIILMTLLGTAVIGGLIYLVIWLCQPKNDILNVTDIGWKRSISIQELKTFDESDWSLPSGARLKTTQSEIYTYEQVIDHYETITETKTRDVIDHYEEYVVGYNDLGNGYAEEITSTRPVYRTETYTETYEKPVYRTEPIYKTKYYYEIDKWINTRSVDTTGNNHEPYWGEYTLSNKERKGGESSNYYIEVINSKGDYKKYDISYDEWININKGDVLNVIIHMFNEIEIISNNEILKIQNN